jgi:hypothetical protein
MEYFLLKPNGELTGTFSIEQVRAMLSTDFIGWDTRYWHEGMTEWRPVDRIEESLKFQPPVPAPSQTVPPQKLAAVLRAVRPPAPRLEASKVPDVRLKPAETRPDVPPAIRSTPPTPSSPPATPTPRLAAEIPPREAPVASPPVREFRSKAARVAERLLCAVFGAAIALAIVYADSAERFIVNALSSKITLSDGNTYVLLDPSAIKTFEQDIQDAPEVEALKNRIGQTTNPVILERLDIEEEKESARHTEEVKQRYIQNGSAELIDPGTYLILAYYDDRGEPTTRRNGDSIWIAIRYKDRTVYAFKKLDSAQNAR